jgi:hypothetical protein
MNVQKWNIDKMCDEPYTLPVDTPLYRPGMDLEAVVACASCGKALAFMHTRPSRLIHNGQGDDYPVCKECYEVEWAAERRYVESLIESGKSLHDAAGWIDEDV